jgi:hypothetical protein
MKRLAKRKIDSLSPISAKVALDFLEFLDAKDDAGATEELLAIPGFLSEFREAEREADNGKVVSLSELRKRRKQSAQGRVD